jgi:hypothetical protein
LAHSRKQWFKEEALTLGIIKKDMIMISKGKKLPLVEVNKKGELTIDGASLAYKPWSTEQLTGKVRVINHFAGRSAAKELNEPLITALKAAEFPKDAYQTTTIINLKDSMWGTGALVVAKAEAGKKAFPWSSVVIDEAGACLAAWGLAKENSAVSVVDENGDVLFFKDGALTSTEIAAVLELIETALQAESA